MNHNSHAFWALQDGMENWTARQWDEWWEGIEAQFAMQDQDFPEWTEPKHSRKQTSKHSVNHTSTAKVSANLRGSRKNDIGRG